MNNIERQKANILKQMLGNPKIYLVIAGTYAEFARWCFRWKIKPQNFAKEGEPFAIFLDDLDKLNGMTFGPKDYRIIMTGLYQANPLFSVADLEKIIEEKVKPVDKKETLVSRIRKWFK